MTPLLTLIQQQEKEFDDKFACTCGGQPCGSVSYEGCIDDIKSFHRATIISLLEGEIAHLEGEKTLILGGGTTFPYQIENRPMRPQEEFFKGKVWHIVEQIARYQSVLDGLKKSV